MNRNPDCPDIEAMERYAAGGLSPSQAAKLEAHLAVCGLCSLVVERLKAFDEASANLSLDPLPEWDAINRRVESVIRQQVPAPAAAAAPRSRFVSWFWTPAVGYAMAAILAYPAWMGLSRRTPPVTELEPSAMPATGAAIVDLNSTRAGTDAPLVREGHRVAVLSFFVPALVGDTHSALIADATGRTVLTFDEIHSYDGRGNFSLVIDPRSFQAGRYVLRVLSGGSAPEVRFEFVRQ